MGKKARTKRGEQRAQGRKVDQSILPPPPPRLEDEIGSQKLLTEPKVPGTRFKVLDAELDGYDDGGVGDLTLIIDLEDHVLRRKRGENAYFSAVKSDVLPRVTNGPMAAWTRRDQKIHLATLLFSDGDVRTDEDEDSSTPSEIYMENAGRDDPELQKRREERLITSKKSLKLSSYLTEPACAAISLTEISKRTLLLKGDSTEGAETALRCADKALLMASDGYYDNDEIALEAEAEPKIDPKHETNATCPGLSNPTNLKYYPKRVAVLCQRAAYLHRGNALAALGRHEEARESYEKVLPLLDPEPRCCRIDWERSSALINIGNSYSRQGNYEKANEYFDKAEKLGVDHMEAKDGNHVEGMGIKIEAMKYRSFALKKNGREDEAKTLLREVISLQRDYSEKMAKDKAAMKKELAKQEKHNAAAAASGGNAAVAAAAAASSNPTPALAAAQAAA